MTLIRFLPVLTAAACSFPWIAYAEGDSIASLVVENDSFGPNDSHYTHGMLASYLYERDKEPEWSKLLRRYHVLDLTQESGKRVSSRIELALGQSIFTPVDITAPVPDPADRPYAGWLYLSGGSIVTRDTVQERLAISLGMVGPSAHAEEVQTNWHHLIGARAPRGWDYQLHDEPTVQAYYEKMWRYDIVGAQGAKVRSQWLVHMGGALGNVFDYLNTGATFRYGTGISDEDYGVPRINPSLPGSGYFQRGLNGIYGFAGFDVRFVARNIFLDGNTFRDSPSVDKRNVVGDLQLGVVGVYGRARLAVTHIWRSKEYHGQKGSDTFDAISVSVAF